jgi:DNA-binding NarL/FixJ family response regulator
MTEERIQLLIVDDNAHFRRGLKALLQSAPDLQVVGEAISGSDAVALAERMQPDVILMDVQMPDLNGIEATRRIVQTSPHIRVVMLTMFDDDSSVFAAIQAGARGYLLKGALRGEVLRAVRAASNNEALFGPAIAQRLMHYFTQVHSAVPPHPFPELSEREREILTLMAQGLNNHDIADRLGLSEKTIRNNVSNILTKLHAADRTEAILRARDAGLGL